MGTRALSASAASLQRVSRPLMVIVSSNDGPSSSIFFSVSFWAFSKINYGEHKNKTLNGIKRIKYKQVLLIERKVILTYRFKKNP